MRSALRWVSVTVLIVVAVEIVLQAASFAGRSILGPGSVGSRRDGEIVILSVGDSHTFGAWLDPADSYPSQLQRALAHHYPNQSVRVANLGIPGTNSAFVANRLERQMLQLRPQVVILWVGVNNLWNVLETEAWGEADLATSIRRILLHSKLFRIGIVTWHIRSVQNSHAKLRGVPGARDRDGNLAWSWDFGGENVRGVPSDQELDLSTIKAGLLFDHDRIVATARALGTSVLFINYPFDYEGVRDVIAASGKQRGIPVIDSRQSVNRAIADGHDRKALMVMAAGPHPSGLLYRYVVADLMPHVVRLIDDVDSLAKEAKVLPTASADHPETAPAP